jgi:endonuclease YncB( thermonuclease family)
MRRTILNIIGFVLVALTTIVLLMLYQAWQNRPVLGNDPELVGNQAQIERVLSTTELELASGETMTLGGITAPRSGEPFAEEGRLAVTALAQGQVVRVEGVPSSAYVYLPDGQLLQAVLIAGGYAQVAPDAPTDEVGESLRLAQFEAQANNLGIWTGQVRVQLPTPRATIELACVSEMVPNSIDGDDASEFIGERQTVVFQPTRSVQRSNGFTLTGDGGNDGFGIVIPNTLLGAAGDSIALEFLNRCVVVTGTIQRDVAGNGARITIERTEDVIILR